MTARLQAPLAHHFEQLPESWRALIQPFVDSPAFASLCAFVDGRVSAGATVFPSTPFTALHLTSLHEVRVVILGQDPYHGLGQAHGLAFSVPQGVRLPPSLRNIYLEVQNDCGCMNSSSDKLKNGNLQPWAEQGVLLLNAVLTVEEGQPASHAGRGWEALTDLIIQRLARATTPKVFALWGSYAQAKKALIEAESFAHCTLRANHPSPLSARRPPVPFLGCRHFSQANAFLQAHARGQIDWCLS